MQIIQIARGNITQRENEKSLYAGELFLDSTRSNGEGTAGYELYVGTDGTHRIKIGADGLLQPTDKVTELPANPVDGAFYLIEEDIVGTGNAEQPDYRAGDYAFWSTKLGNKDGQWYRVNNGGGTAAETSFDNANTNYDTETTTVQEALVEVDRNKLEFGGDLAAANDYNGTFAELFTKAKLKAGKFYLVKSDIKVGGVDFEEGDFLAVVSDVITNDKELEVSDCEMLKIPGGTHTAEKIKYTMGPRNATANGLYSDTDTEATTKDSSITNVKDALDQILVTTPTLGHDGKIILSQLPDTVIGAMEFQKIYVAPKDETSFRVPTVDDLSSDDTALTKGDYWIYSGPRLPVDKTVVESSEGFINTGDWIVYVGADKWAVVDNTSPITGIKGEEGESATDDDTINQEDKTLVGAVTIKGNTRTGTTIKEVKTTVDNTNGPSIIVKSENAALIETAADKNTIYKEDGNKTLVATGLTDDGSRLTIDETKGIKLVGGNNNETDCKDVYIIQNSKATDEVEVTLPAKSGTLATKEEVLNEGTDFYIPRYSEDDNGDITLVNSPLEVTLDAADKYDGFTYHNSDTNSSKFVIKESTIQDVATVIHTLPSVSGGILNTNSIIDCGEWTTDGYKTTNSGKFDTTDYGTVGDNISE